MIKNEVNGKIVYSDGSQVEKDMLAIAKKHPETSASDYIADDSRYTVNNTFSLVRNNVLNWYPFKQGCTILEVGAGMGAVTGLLCDKADRVVSVEMNNNRAEVIRARYPQRLNLFIQNVDITEWETEERFDYVVVIGVWEYASVFMTGENPHLRFLTKLKSFLKDDGILLLAIENQFGLKYWLGASEDHLQKPFEGIRGYEEKNTPRTFGKGIIQKLFSEAGLVNQRFYYLLPDYKFPVSVYTDECLPDYYDLQNITFFYGRNSTLTARESKVYKDILENGQFGFFANSYLVEAAKSSLPTSHIIRAQGRGECKPQYRIITTIDSDGNVCKRAADPRALRHIQNTFEIGEMLRLRGVEHIKQELEGDAIHTRMQMLPSANQIVQEAIVKGDEARIFHMIELLKKNLLKSNGLESSKKENNEVEIRSGNTNGIKDKAGSVTLHDGFMDMNFCNAFYDKKKDQMIFYDQEWKFAELPLLFQLYYAVKLSFERLSGEPKVTKESINEYIGIKPEQYAEFDQLERSIWESVLSRTGDIYGEDGYCNIFNDEMTIDRQNYRRKEELEALSSVLEAEKTENMNMKGHIEQLIESERVLKGETESQQGHIEQLIESERTLKRKEESQQGYIEQLTESERALKREVESQQEHIEQLIESNSVLKDEIESKQCQIEQLKTEGHHYEEQRNVVVRERDELKGYLADAKTEINNKQGHIDLLLESDRELQQIKHSRSYRALTHWWKFRDKVVPPNSRRRLVVKLFGKFARHPIMFIKKADKRHIKTFVTGVKDGSILSTAARLDNYLGGGDVNAERPDQFPITEFESIGAVPKLHVPTSNHPTVSIVIPVYNQFAYTYACLKSIAKNSGDILYEVIIADDCSTDLTKHIGEAVTGIRVIRNNENLRFLLNCNNAAKQAKGKYILFLNNDTQVMPGWLEPLVSLIEQDADENNKRIAQQNISEVKNTFLKQARQEKAHTKRLQQKIQEKQQKQRAKIGMVGSKLIYPDGRLQEAGGILWKDASAWNYGHLQDPTMPEYNYVKEVDYISGAAIMIRADLWNQLGGFDERYVPAYCEDSDLAFMVRQAGFKVVYQPKSVVIHFEGISNGTDTSSGLKAYQVENTKKFYDKWKNVLEKEHNPNGVNPFLARDRSFSKKTMLFVDHYVPQYDKDAGSRTVFAYIRMFARAGFNIKFIGDNFFPHQPYTSVLQQMGVEVLYGNWYAQHWKEWLSENADSFDYAFLNRPHIAVKYIDLIREKTKAKILYYGHDLHFVRCHREYEVTGNPKLLGEAEDWKAKELALMRKSDITTYPSQIEIDEIHRIDPDIKALAIPAYIFDSVDSAEYMLNERRDLFFIGGYTHGPNVDAVKWFVGNILPIVCKDIPDIRIHIAGSNMPQDLIDLASEHVIIEGMLSDEQLEKFYHTIRLNVVPLRYGAGIKGKIVESMRYGLPVVTTPCGAEGIIGAESVLAIANSAEDIARRIISVYNDEKELKRMSEGGKQYILTHYSEKEAIDVMKNVFEWPSSEKTK